LGLIIQKFKLYCSAAIAAPEH